MVNIIFKIYAFLNLEHSSVCHFFAIIKLSTCAPRWEDSGGQAYLMEEGGEVDVVVNSTLSVPFFWLRGEAGP